MLQPGNLCIVTGGKVTRVIGHTVVVILPTGPVNIGGFIIPDAWVAQYVRSGRQVLLSERWLTCLDGYEPAPGDLGAYLR